MWSLSVLYSLHFIALLCFFMLSPVAPSLLLAAVLCRSAGGSKKDDTYIFVDIYKL